VTLRPVVPEDREFLLRVYAATREEELSVVPWDADRKAAFLEMQFTAQDTDYRANYPGSDYHVVLWEGGAAGRIWVSRSEEEIRLLDIALLPEFRNRGIGSHLVGRLIEEARAAGKPLRHMVLRENQDAIRFYGRLGFNIVDQVPFYFLMERLPGS
jgi:ribosomal protein S18 acetylase RimI-like enzyme